MAKLSGVFFRRSLVWKWLTTSTPASRAIAENMILDALTVSPMYLGVSWATRYAGVRADQQLHLGPKPLRP